MEGKMVKFIVLFFVLGGTIVTAASSVTNVPKVVSVTFLVTVNDTWYPDEHNTTCLKTVKTPALAPNGKWNATQNKIFVGDCDQGPLTYTVDASIDEKKQLHATIDVIFYSSVIEDASHPECKIQWDFQYQDPTASDPNRSPLPGCSLGDSREGYHMTYYWFHVFDWVLG